MTAEQRNSARVQHVLDLDDSSRYMTPPSCVYAHVEYIFHALLHFATLTCQTPHAAECSERSRASDNQRDLVCRLAPTVHRSVNCLIDVRRRVRKDSLVLKAKK